MTDPATGEDVEYDYAYYDDTPPESPFVNPYDPSHQQPDLLAGNLAGESHLSKPFTKYIVNIVERELPLKQVRKHNSPK